VNIVAASFNTIIGQMTEMSRRKTRVWKCVRIQLWRHSAKCKRNRVVTLQSWVDKDATISRVVVKCNGTRLSAAVDCPNLDS